MTRPPVPPGLPPKPAAATPYGGDSYRPQQNVNHYPRNASREPLNQFRGGYDSQSPYDLRSHPQYSYGPAAAAHRGPSGGDTYRPLEGRFDFRYEAPPSIDLRQANNYRPRS